MSSRFKFETKNLEFEIASSKISTGTHVHFWRKNPKGFLVDTSFANTANGDIQPIEKVQSEISMPCWRAQNGSQETTAKMSKICKIGG
jgi:hypothetical protein